MTCKNKREKWNRERQREAKRDGNVYDPRRFTDRRITKETHQHRRWRCFLGWSFVSYTRTRVILCAAISWRTRNRECSINLITWYNRQSEIPKRDTFVRLCYTQRRKHYRTSGNLFFVVTLNLSRMDNK